MGNWTKDELEFIRKDLERSIENVSTSLYADIFSQITRLENVSEDLKRIYEGDKNVSINALGELQNTHQINAKCGILYSYLEMRRRFDEF